MPNLTESQPVPTSSSESNHSLEMAHVLFMDIVGYSQLPMDQQEQAVRHLQQAVRETQEFARAQANGKLIRLPAGDGMALVFFDNVESPACCAFQLHRILRRWPEIRLRMGIHTGPIYRVQDINEALNVAGGGINIAQRVMDCGDAGHILISSSVADVLDQVSKWKALLHDLGEAEVKHRLIVHLYNLYTEEVGNRELPQKLRFAKTIGRRARSIAKRRKFSVGLVSLGFAAAALVAGGLYYRRSAHVLTGRDSVVLADFTNTTGDPVFNDALKQGLAVALKQSPYLNILSEKNVTTMLSYMRLPADQTLTRDVARQICLRAGSKAMLLGSISIIGSHYVVGLNAENCQDGDLLDSEQMEAIGKEEVLSKLREAATSMREKLGESLASIHKYDTPLQQTTTGSLEALQAYSQAVRTEYSGGDMAALPLLKRAVELDPNFAIAYAQLANVYSNLGEMALSVEAAEKAHDLRERVTEHERLYIDSSYFYATGELDKEAQVYQQWKQIYTRDQLPYAFLALYDAQMGRYDNAAEGFQEALRLEPTDVNNYVMLAASFINLNQPDKARDVLRDVRARQLDHQALPLLFYLLSFMQNDPTEMEKWASAAAGKPGSEDLLLAYQSDTAALHGRMRNARDLSRRAVDSALRNGEKGAAAGWQAHAALFEAELGDAVRARQQSAAALALAPTKDVQTTAALALARAGDINRAQMIVDKLQEQFPSDTLLNNYSLPSIRAAIAITHKNPQSAIVDLEVTRAYETGGYPLAQDTLYPIYLRGEAFLMQGKGVAAASEFEKMLNHRGRLGNSPLGALAQLQLAKAHKLSNDTPQAQIEYETCLKLWKDADLDLPALRQARIQFTLSK